MQICPRLTYACLNLQKICPNILNEFVQNHKKLYPNAGKNLRMFVQILTSKLALKMILLNLQLQANFKTNGLYLKAN